MKQTLNLLFFLFISFNCSAQGWTWGKSSGVVDGWLCRTDVHNNVYIGGVWQNLSTTIGSNTYFNFNPGPNNYETALAKYDSAGNFLWSCASTLGQAWPMDIVTDKAGNAYFYGCFWTDSLIIDSQLLINTHVDSCLYPCDYAVGCYFIMKFDQAGHVVWAKTGNNLADPSGRIAIDDAANIYISGSFKNAFIPIGQDTLYNTFYKRSDMFLAKYDSSGNALWAKGFGGIFNEYAGGVVVGSDNKVYLSGVFNSPTIIFGATTLSYVSSMPLDSISNTFLAKFDTSGNAIWAKSCVGSALAYSMTIDNENNVFLGGEVYDTSYAAFDTDTLKGPTIKWAGFITKYDSAGNVKWANGIYNKTSSVVPLQIANRVWGLAADSCGNIWLAARMSGDTAGIYLDGTTILHSPSGSIDPMFIAGYDASGLLLQYLSLKSGGEDDSRIAIDRAQNVYLCGDAEAVTIFFGSDSVRGQGGETMFLAKYNPNICSPALKVSNPDNLQDITLYPNPATSTITIQYNNIDKATATIYDITGRLMGNYPLTGSTTTISVQNLLPGIYQCRITDGQHNVVTKKLAIMR